MKQKVCDHLPWYSERISELESEVARIQRSRSTIKSTSTKYEQLTKKLRLMNSQLKGETGEQIRKYLEELHRVKDVEQFWKKWKRSKTSYNDQIPIFEGNKSNTKEENLEIIFNQFVRPAEYKYQKLKL